MGYIGLGAEDIKKGPIFSILMALITSRSQKSIANFQDYVKIRLSELGQGIIDNYEKCHNRVEALRIQIAAQKKLWLKYYDQC